MHDFEFNGNEMFYSSKFCLILWIRSAPKSVNIEITNLFSAKLFFLFHKQKKTLITYIYIVNKNNTT